MIYKFFFNLASDISFFSLFQYITFRSFIAFFSSFFICWFFGYLFISRSKARLSEKINTDAPASHQKKQGIPTMGGIFVLFSFFLVCFLWADLFQPLVWGSLVIVAGFSAIGFCDDWLKIKNNNFYGIKGWLRLCLELTLCTCVLGILLYKGNIDTVLYVPVFKNLSWDLGGLYLLFGAIVITGTANAVNLTDGLDGLAVFPVLICAGTLSVFTYSAGHYELAEYLNIPFVSGAGELTVLISAVVASGLGFLWYNFYPAQIFMGDVGSLGLGSFLGVIAVITKNEILLVILGGIFVVEALSVIFQVLSFKTTGRRILKMAPLHHHFELKGLDESKIIIRFWIVAILLAVLSLSLLKVR